MQFRLPIKQGEFKSGDVNALIDVELSSPIDVESILVGTIRGATEENSPIGVHASSSNAMDESSSIPINQDLLGITVASIEEAYNLYNDYASRLGFSVRKGKQYYVPGTQIIKIKKFHCAKADFKSNTNKSSRSYSSVDTRTGCTAGCQFDMASNGQLIVTKQVKDHNHELCPPSKSYLLRSHRSVGANQLSYVKDLKRSGFALSDDIRFLKHQSRGSPFVGFTPRDAYNSLLTDSIKSLDGTDSNSLIDIFRQRQLNDLTFSLILKWMAMQDCTFLRAMDGKCPQTIMTDQCSAMSAAISQVFPSARHRLCIWHIGENSKKHIKGLRSQKGFMQLFNLLLKYTDTEVEFEFYWNRMMTEYKCHTNAWLDKLYDIREKWCPAFSKDYFSGVDECKENGEDVRCSQGLPTMALDHVKLLLHARNVYTIEVYYLFEKQYLKGVACHQEIVASNANEFKYHIWRPDIDIIRHEVCFNMKDMTICCTCKFFSEMGILCSHCLRIFNIHCIEKIPEKYICNRWTKKVVEDRIMDIASSSSTLTIASPIWVIEMGRKLQRLVLSSQDNCKARQVCEEIFEDGRIRIEGEQVVSDIAGSGYLVHPSGNTSSELICG
ncbi:protein FAR1-RELATED SEQUENCE 7-like [Ipomoea triloba]|uniref:protein FAR1-RELATED SEQUENCE 7-like n=1 Tax=Ipomoea triloba TaxID=35885 RepID=UPI00125DB9FB|nr:protein FAR1-RELATED SEQUENCE 7-like [Ipomoea triloba]